jgi:hypothetical protein
MIYSPALPTRKCDIRWLRQTSLRIILVYSRHKHRCDAQVYQAVKDVSTSYDALVDLLESIEHFMNRLDIYTRVPSTGPMVEIIMKIMVELLSTPFPRNETGKSEPTK